MRKYQKLIWLLFFASLWGMSEVMAGGALYEMEVPRASIWLNVWAFFLLAVARGFVNRPGTSTALGCIAALYRMVNAAPFFCHFWGIVFTGLAFDIAFSLLMKRKQESFFRSSLAGLTGAFGGHALFSMVLTWIFRHEYWVGGGWPKVLDHIFVSGSLVAVAALGTVPFGYWLGKRGEALTQRRPRWAYTGAVLAVLVFWTIGRIGR